MRKLRREVEKKDGRKEMCPGDQRSCNVCRVQHTVLYGMQNFCLGAACYNYKIFNSDLIINNIS